MSTQHRKLSFLGTILENWGPDMQKKKKSEYFLDMEKASKL